MSRDEMLRRISELDFFIIDIHLYLNTHPDDDEAIALYNNCVMQVRQLRDEYNAQFGMLLANNCTSKMPWQWIDNPWPWQKSFNFELTEENG
ncbi:MAG: spore coat protein CotJB [Oscillospiraceae bacterium]|nr:spore coat protein CotJB [Oscillospiraceae bacterium]